MEPCRPWNKVEPIIITVPEETREIVKEYLHNRRQKAKRNDKVKDKPVIEEPSMKED